MRVFISSEDAISPKLMALMKHAKEIGGITEKIEFSDAVQNIHDKATVLALGPYKRVGSERVVALPSGKALMTRADSVTRIKTAFKMLVDPPVLEPMKWRLYDSVEHLEELLAVLSVCRRKELVVDIETSGNVDEDLPHPEALIAVSILGDGAALVIGETLLDLPEVLEALDRLLENNKIIGQNFKFDGKYFPNAKFKLYFDTMLAHYALYPAASSHGLKDLAKMYFGAEDWDAPAKAYTRGATYTEHTALEDGAWAAARKYAANSGYERIPRAKLYLYGAQDVYYTRHLYLMLKQYLEDDADAMSVFRNILMPLSDMFLRFEVRGVRFNLEYIKALEKDYAAAGERLEAELHEMVGFALNPRSPKQVKDYFISDGYRIKSTDAASMTELAEKGNSVATKILELRDNNKTLGTYIRGYLKKMHGDRAYPGFKLHASTTGRLGGAGASMLTMPRDKKLKKMVIPYEDDHVLVGADMSQAELRCMAVESNDHWMIAAFQEGAGDFFDIMMEATYPDINAKQFKLDDLGAYTNLRAKLKGATYGKSFNRGDRAIALALGITLEEATTLSNGFVRPGSEFDLWRKEIERKAVQGESIVTRFGRHFQSEVVTERNRQSVINSALAFTSQSTANDILLTAALNIVPQLEQYNALPVTTLHDAFYVSCKPEVAEPVGQLVCQEILKSAHACYGDAVQFVSDWGIGNNLSEV